MALYLYISKIISILLLYSLVSLTTVFLFVYTSKTMQPIDVCYILWGKVKLKLKVLYLLVPLIWIYFVTCHFDPMCHFKQ